MKIEASKVIKKKSFSKSSLTVFLPFKNCTWTACILPKTEIESILNKTMDEVVKLSSWMFRICKNIAAHKKSALYSFNSPTDPLSYWSRPLCREVGVESRLNGFWSITSPFTHPNQPNMVSNESWHLYLYVE